jgi:hypothetical protein
MKVTTTLLFSLLLFSQVATAQITLTASNAPIARTAHRIRDVDSLASARLVVTAAGATAQTWNFSTLALVPAPAVMTTFAVTTGAPSASSFPTATLTSREGSTNFKEVSYHRINATEWSILGSVDSTGQVTVNPDPQTFFRYPFTMNSTFKDTFALEDPDFGRFEVKTVSTGDAWGSVQTSLGTFNSIRVKRASIATFSFLGFPIKLDIASTEWWTAQYTAPVLTHQRTIVIADFLPAPDTSFSASILTAQTVGVKEVEVNHIASAFPSPANTLMTLDIDVPTASKVAALLISSSGQTLKTRNFGDLPAGKQQVSFDVTDIPSGAYQLILMSDKGKLGSQKIMVTH